MKNQNDSISVLACLEIHLYWALIYESHLTDGPSQSNEIKKEERENLMDDLSI